MLVMPAEYTIEINPGAAELLAAFGERDVDDDQRTVEKETALQALAYALGKNFGAAEATEKDGVFCLSFKVTWNRNEVPTEVKATSRCSKVSTAEIALSCKTDD